MYKLKKFLKKKMHYFLLSYKNKRFVCSNKNTLITKADEIVSQHIFNLVTQTGSSYSYEKLVYDTDDETTFSIVTKNCNLLFSQEQEERICTISNAELIEFVENVCENVCENSNNSDYHQADNQENDENTFEHISHNNEKKVD